MVNSEAGLVFGQLVGIDPTCEASRNHTYCSRPSNTIIIITSKMNKGCVDKKAVNFTKNYQKEFFLRHKCPETHFGEFQ